MAAGIPARLSPAEGRKFAFTVGTAFLVLAGITWWRDHPLLMRVFGGLGGGLFVLGTVVPAYLGPVQRAWMGLAHAISKVTTPIFMGVVYYVVITPIGLFMRLTGRQPMRHAARDGGFWLAPPSGGRSNLETQF